MVGRIKRLLNSHRVQNNRDVFFFSCMSFLSQAAAAFTIEFECHAFSARVVWLSTDRELCWIPFLSSCFNQCELALLSHFTRGDFSASPLCRWFWLPLPSLIFKRWILVLTGKLTLLPSLSPGCLPYCFTGLGILGHMLMRIMLKQRIQDASTGVLDSVTGIIHKQETSDLFDWHMDESGMGICSLYSNTPLLYPFNIHIRWQRSTCAVYSSKYMDYGLAQSLYIGSCAVMYRISISLLKPLNVHQI